MDNKLTVQIYGKKYPITANEDPSYVTQLAVELDKTVHAVMKSSDRLSINDALVLACLSYIDSYRKSEQGADNLRRQISDYADDASKARAELADARKEISRLEHKKNV